MLLEPVETELFEDSQTLFREVNERVREVNLTFGRTARLTEFVCECSDPECTERLALSIEEFDAVRAHPDRRIIRAGHTSLELRAHGRRVRDLLGRGATRCAQGRRPHLRLP